MTAPGRASPLGGVCLVPNTRGGEYPEGIVVAWTPHDRLGRDAYGPDPTRDRLYHTLQQVMNEDLRLPLETAGCALQPFGQAGAALVTAAPAGPQRRERGSHPPGEHPACTPAKRGPDAPGN
jgi:hypothetical protein